VKECRRSLTLGRRVRRGVKEVECSLLYRPLDRFRPQFSLSVSPATRVQPTEVLQVEGGGARCSLDTMESLQCDPVVQRTKHIQYTYGAQRTPSFAVRRVYRACVRRIALPLRTCWSA
jgi:hypothetical protein